MDILSDQDYRFGFDDYGDDLVIPIRCLKFATSIGLDSRTILILILDQDTLVILLRADRYI